MVGRKKSPASADILSYFPYDTPRDSQAQTLRSIQANWDKADVIVIRTPTAGGKTPISLATSRWAHMVRKKRSIICHPDNALVRQFKDAFPRMHVLWKKAAYTCQLHTGNMGEPISCEEAHRRKGNEKMSCHDCPYLKAVKLSHVLPYMTCNFHTYVAHSLYRSHPVVIFDEAHTLEALARDRAAKRLWHKDYGYPTYIRSYGQLLEWAAKRREERPDDKKLALLVEELEGGKRKYLVEKTEELLRGKWEHCLKLLPVDVSDKCDFLWPAKKVEKIILMSATLSTKDIEALGLVGKRVIYLDVESPIPVENRPIETYFLGSMAYKSQDNIVPQLCGTIDAVLSENPHSKGLCHAPYSLARKIQAHMGGNPRLLFHFQDDKLDKLAEFKESAPEDGKLLIASGMEAGIDLPYDAARYQLICKVPYASLAEPAMRYLAETNPEMYAWLAIRLVVQAAGRVCRAPDDQGATIILDSDFKRLYNTYEHLFPQFFRDALTMED